MRKDEIAGSYCELFQVTNIKFLNYYFYVSRRLLRIKMISTEEAQIFLLTLNNEFHKFPPLFLWDYSLNIIQDSGSYSLSFSLMGRSSGLLHPIVDVPV